MDVSIQIYIISVVTMLLTIFVGWQAYRLGEIMNASFGKWEALAWVVVILYRGYGLTSLAEDVDQLKKAGYIVESLSFRQWIGIAGYFIFLCLMSYSKHLKRKRIRQNLGI